MKYLDFILQKSIDDLKREGGNRLDYDTVGKYFEYVKKAGDTLKAVYTLMHIAKMKDTAVYLVFVLKKVGEGAVDFDTLEENAKEDCEFIKKELIKNFSLSGDAGEEPELKIPEISGSGLSEMIKENRFKVKHEDDASIAEEFSEKEMYEDDLTDDSEQITGDEVEEDNSDEELRVTFGDEEFELISNSEEGDEGFEILDTTKQQTENEIETEIVNEETENKIESEPEVDEKFSEISDEPEEEILPYEEMEGEGFVIKKTISSSEKNPEEKISSAEEEDFDTPDEKTDEIVVQEVVEEVVMTVEEDAVEDGEQVPEQEVTDDMDRDERLEETEEVAGTVMSGASQGIEEEAEQEPVEDIGTDVDKDVTPEEILEEEETEIDPIPDPEVSEQYKDYERTLFEVNELLKDYYLDIEAVPEGSSSPDGEPVIFGKISELCGIMRKRSDAMSFSLISNVYDCTGKIFKEYLKTNSRPNGEELASLNKGIQLVEGLIKGDDLPEADDILLSLETLRKSFSDAPVTAEKTADAKDEAEQLEEVKEKAEHKEPAKVSASLKEKYSNSELRDSFKQMKLQIQDLENTFLSLDEIEGDYQNYEGLRTLSSTFLNLKEIIRRAKILDLKDVAKLSEASYVFIKFIQNYRMDPFDEDIREIFKYIIYNFKAAALDKPNEDLEKFISYLNDPVKIFTQKTKKGN